MLLADEVTCNIHVLVGRSYMLETHASRKKLQQTCARQKKLHVTNMCPAEEVRCSKQLAKEVTCNKHMPG